MVDALARGERRHRRIQLDTTAGGRPRARGAVGVSVPGWIRNRWTPSRAGSGPEKYSANLPSFRAVLVGGERRDRRLDRPDPDVALPRHPRQMVSASRLR